ncbi:MAG TPA: DinB family protein [Bryobacteraceae bacterium]|nr:DinB family protein [Bryobacteraceae bacterium]
MKSLIGDLMDHLAWADAAIFKAIGANEGAASDESLRKTLHHIVMVQRAFLSLFLKRPFDMEKESRVPASLAEFEPLFREAHQEEIEFVKNVDEAALSARFEMPWIPGAKLTLEQALMQVVMHSQSHRGQCAARLRALGGSPPMTDFIVWLKDRPAPVWS